MNWSNIWALTKINLLYSNPQLLTSVKKKQAKSQKATPIYQSMLRQQGLGLVVMVAVYSYLFVGVDYSRFPGQFAVQLALFLLVSLINGFTSFFAIFYESNDTKLYLPLPLTSGEVYLAKLLSAQGSILTYLSPLLALLGICYWQLTGSLLSVLLVVPIFVLLLLFVNLVGLTLIHCIGEILSKSPYKKMVSTILMIGSTILAIGALLFVQFTSQRQMMSEHPTDMPNLYLIRGYYDIVARPFSLEAMLHFGLSLVVIVLLSFFVIKKVIPAYYQQILAIERVQSNRKKGKVKTIKESSLRRALCKHHLSTLLDGTLIVQTYLIPLLYIFMFSGPVLSGKLVLATFDQGFFGIAFLVGAFFGVFFGSVNSFLGVAISLERTHYTFLKTLPLNFKSFLIEKFLLVSLVQHGLPFLVYLLVALWLKTPLILLVSFLLGLFVSAMLIGQIIYWRDKRLLNLNWQNVNQLFSRGHGNLLIALGMVAFIIFCVFSTIYLVQLAFSVDILLVNFLVFFVLLVLGSGLQTIIYQRFWKKL